MIKNGTMCAACPREISLSKNYLNLLRGWGDSSFCGGCLHNKRELEKLVSAQERMADAISAKKEGI